MWARLLAAGARAHVLVLVIHHIATDGWSTGIVARDLAPRTRPGGTAGRRTGAAAGAVRRLRDLAAGPARRAGDPGSLLARQVAWWREALAGAPAELALPADRPRPAVPSHRGHAVPVQVPAEWTRGLAALARAQGVTLFMVVQAAVAVLLSRLGAGEDIPAGTGVAGRTDTALDDLVGFFVNTLVLRTDVSGDPAFAELLGRVREFWLGALEHQDVPFERLVEELAPDRSLARHPLFQVLVTVQNNAPASGSCPGCGSPGCRPGPGRPGSTWNSPGRGTRREGRPGGLRGLLTAAADLFDPATARMIAGRLGRVLAAVAAGPGTRLRQVQVLDPAERAQVVDGLERHGRAGSGRHGAGADHRAGGADPGCDGGGVRGRRGQLRGTGGAGGPAGAVPAAGGCGPGDGGGVVPGPGLEWHGVWGHGWRGRRTCRWIRATRRRGWGTCWPPAGRGCW